MTEAGIVGKVGVSSAGVAVLLNILGHRDDGPPIGVPVHVLTRSVLTTPPMPCRRWRCSQPPRCRRRAP
jgi:hypothetical protein